ncbi:leucine carboxyl methyltransferase [Panaeolus papilionaceus]|nr:leucine carboxyl methyltransferase [Panaeolus papilionaceus]
MFPPPRDRPQAGDAPVRGTDNDAALARLSAVQKSYLQDPFIKYLVPRAHLQPPRPPLINIGTYVRSAGIDELVDQWLQVSQQAEKKCQILSLGAGSDTRFWRIATGPLNKQLRMYIEIDLPDNTTKKAMAIKKHRELVNILGESTVAQGGTALRSSRYNLLPGDLRHPPDELFGPLYREGVEGQPPILDSELPTLILFECVLAYIEPTISSRLLRWFTNVGQQSSGGVLGCIVYEMFGLLDAFGRVMINNLKERSITIPGAMPYNTIGSVSDRLLDSGFKSAQALTLKDIRRDYTSEEELERISRLEFLDETEELDLVLAHYAISWGLEAHGSAGSFWNQWSIEKKPRSKDED